LNRDEPELKSIKEEPFDPELPICDAHHHLWDDEDKRYLLEDFFKDIKEGHNIVKTIFVESKSVENGLNQVVNPERETQFAHQVAKQNANGHYGKTEFNSGIVGFADLCLGPAVTEVLDAHMEASDRFCGIRQISSWDVHTDVIFSPSRPGLLLDNHFRSGFKYLKAYGLCFETFLYHPQIRDLQDLARAFPDTPIILDHIGGPLFIGPYAVDKKRVYQDWKYNIVALARCSNVFIKLGGLGMPFCGFKWNTQNSSPNSMILAESMKPFYQWCIEKFGVDRCMFESNFPVDREAYSYIALWNAFKIITKDFSDSERNSLFHDTAVRIYGLRERVVRDI
jgi:predicted TIM-barrel fold metal-dependent hydrolase